MNTELQSAPIRYRSPGYAALNVTDLDRAQVWYRDIMGAQLNGTTEDGGLMLRTGGMDSYSLLLYGAAQAGMKRVGWLLEDETQFQVLTDRLDRHQVAWRDLSAAECATTRLERAVRMIDPITGLTLDFYVRMEQAASAFVPTVTHLEGLCHVGIGTDRYRDAIRFYEDVLNFKTSDEIDGRINLMRCFPNPLHHSLALANAPRNTLHHLNFMVSDDRDMVAARARFAEHQVPVVWDGHHPPSGNTFLFFLDPDGLSLEYGHGMELFPEIGARARRVFPARPESFDSTGAHRDERTAAVGEIEVQCLT